MNHQKNKNQKGKQGEVHQQTSTLNLKDHQDEQQHITAGEYIKSAVYGGVDGLVTILSLTYSGVGSSVGADVIVAIGISSLIADAISMAVSDYLATKSDAEYMEAEQIREQEQIDKDFEAQKRQMKALYGQMGLKPEVSDQIVDILSTNKEGFLKVMMIEQLQLIADEQNPIRNSLVTLFSFIIFGVFPLVPYFVASNNKQEVNYRHNVIAASIGIVIIMILGIGKSVISDVKWWYSCIQTFFVVGISVAVGYGIGVAFGAG